MTCCEVGALVQDGRSAQGPDQRSNEFSSADNERASKEMLTVVTQRSAGRARAVQCSESESESEYQEPKAMAAACVRMQGATVVVVARRLSGACLLCLACRCRCFGRSCALPAPQPITAASSAHLQHHRVGRCLFCNPTPRGSLTERPEPIPMLTKLQPLRATLLQLTPTIRTSTSTIHPLLSCALQTMAAKPSLQAAEDFLSFVNASPTRECSLVHATLHHH